MESESQSVDTGTEEMMDQPLPDLRAEPLPPTATSETDYVSPVKVFVACLAAILFPGLGHLMVGRWARACLLSLVIVGMFGLGLFWLQGHLYQPDPGEPLTTFPFLANAGLGGVYALCYFWKVGFEAHAAAPGFEFGNTLLFGAGLLNYLMILDVFDLAVGRKG